MHFLTFLEISLILSFIKVIMIVDKYEFKVDMTLKARKWNKKRPSLPWYSRFLFFLLFFTYLLRIMREKKQKVYCLQILVSLNTYLAWNVPSDLVNLRCHQYAQNRKSKIHTQWITGTVYYFYRFLKFGAMKFDIWMKWRI